MLRCHRWPGYTIICCALTVAIRMASFCFFSFFRDGLAARCCPGAPSLGRAVLWVPLILYATYVWREHTPSSTNVKRPREKLLLRSNRPCAPPCAAVCVSHSRLAEIVPAFAAAQDVGLEQTPRGSVRKSASPNVFRSRFLFWKLWNVACEVFKRRARRALPGGHRSPGSVPPGPPATEGNKAKQRKRQTTEQRNRDELGNSARARCRVPLHSPAQVDRSGFSPPVSPAAANAHIFTRPFRVLLASPAHAKQDGHVPNTTELYRKNVAVIAKTPAPSETENERDHAGRRIEVTTNDNQQPAGNSTATEGKRQRPEKLVVTATLLGRPDRAAARETKLLSEASLSECVNLMIVKESHDATRKCKPNTCGGAPWRRLSTQLPVIRSEPSGVIGKKEQRLDREIQANLEEKESQREAISQYSAAVERPKEKKEERLRDLWTTGGSSISGRLRNLSKILPAYRVAGRTRTHTSAEAVALGSRITLSASFDEAGTEDLSLTLPHGNIVSNMLTGRSTVQRHPASVVEDGLRNFEWNLGLRVSPGLADVLPPSSARESKKREKGSEHAAKYFPTEGRDLAQEAREERGTVAHDSSASSKRPPEQSLITYRYDPGAFQAVVVGSVKEQNLIYARGLARPYALREREKHTESNSRAVQEARKGRLAITHGAYSRILQAQRHTKRTSRSVPAATQDNSTTVTEVERARKIFSRLRPRKSERAHPHRKLKLPLLQGAILTMIATVVLIHSYLEKTAALQAEIQQLEEQNQLESEEEVEEQERPTLEQKQERPTLERKSMLQHFTALPHFVKRLLAGLLVLTVAVYAGLIPRLSNLAAMLAVKLYSIFEDLPETVLERLEKLPGLLEGDPLNLLQMAFSQATAFLVLAIEAMYLSPILAVLVTALHLYINERNK